MGQAHRHGHHLLRRARHVQRGAQQQGNLVLRVHLQVQRLFAAQLGPMQHEDAWLVAVRFGRRLGATDRPVSLWFSNSLRNNTAQRALVDRSLLLEAA